MHEWIMLLYTWYKQTNKQATTTKTPLYNTVSHIYTKTKKVTKRECWLYSFQALVTQVAATSLKPGQPWVPWTECPGAEGGGEDVPANEPCPWTWRACSPLHWPTTSRYRQDLLQWNYTYCTQRRWSFRAGRALESPLGSTSPGDGVPTSTFFP